MDSLVYYREVKLKQISQCKHLKVFRAIAGIPAENKNKAVNFYNELQKL